MNTSCIADVFQILINVLHNRLCSPLTPQCAGWQMSPILFEQHTYQAAANYPPWSACTNLVLGVFWQCSCISRIALQTRSSASYLILNMQTVSWVRKKKNRTPDSKLWFRRLYLMKGCFYLREKLLQILLLFRSYKYCCYSVHFYIIFFL